MARRTYLPQLARIVMRACMYIQKHRPILAANLSGDALIAADAVVTACQTLQKYLIQEQP